MGRDKYSDLSSALGRGVSASAPSVFGAGSFCHGAFKKQNKTKKTAFKCLRRSLQVPPLHFFFFFNIDVFGSVPLRAEGPGDPGLGLGPDFTCVSSATDDGACSGVNRSPEKHTSCPEPPDLCGRPY